MTQKYRIKKGKKSFVTFEIKEIFEIKNLEALGLFVFFSACMESNLTHEEACNLARETMGISDHKMFELNKIAIDSF